MVSITTMIVIANVQSSINAMVPKTSYLKMIDYFLTYSFNIIVIVMIYHTYISLHIQEVFSPNEDDKPVDKMKEARRINKQGQIIFVIAFVGFQVIFWSVGLAEFFSDKNIEKMTELEELRELELTKKVV